jgi:hypothetical protein
MNMRKYIIAGLSVLALTQTAIASGGGLPLLSLECLGRGLPPLALPTVIAEASQPIVCYVNNTTENDEGKGSEVYPFRRIDTALRYISSLPASSITPVINIVATNTPYDEVVMAISRNIQINGIAANGVPFPTVRGISTTASHARVRVKLSNIFVS